MDGANRKVLVTGATGRQGGAVTTHLIAGGFLVRALSRNPESAAARKLAQSGVEIREHLPNPTTFESFAQKHLRA